jgi:hypothetical protein
MTKDELKAEVTRRLGLKGEVDADKLGEMMDAHLTPYAGTYKFDGGGVGWLEREMTRKITANGRAALNRAREAAHK